MLKSLLIPFLFISLIQPPAEVRNPRGSLACDCFRHISPEECRFRGFSLYRPSVRVVAEYESPDMKLRIVDSSDADFAILPMKNPNSYTSGRCGQWYFMKESDRFRPDFTVAFVSAGEDLRVVICDR